MIFRSKPSSSPTVLYRTRDYTVTVGQSNSAALPDILKTLYVLTHEAHGVVHGMSHNLADAIYGAEEVQAALDAAVASPKKRPTAELTPYQQAALLGMGTAGGSA